MSILDNDILNVGIGLYVSDDAMYWGLGKAVDVVIEKNRIDLNGTGPWWGGAIYSRFVKDSVISANTITGQAVGSAINIRGEGNLLIGNNVENVSSQWGWEPIWLWDTSETNIVFGSGNLKENVFDEGINNTIVGSD